MPESSELIPAEDDLLQPFCMSHFSSERQEEDSVNGNHDHPPDPHPSEVGLCSRTRSEGRKVTKTRGRIHRIYNQVPKFQDEVDDIAGFSFTFRTWCMSLSRWVLRSRTGFGFFLSQTLSLSRDGPQAPPTALFPLPMPCERPYAAGPVGFSSRLSRSQAVDRALHVIVCAMNFMYWSRSLPSLDLIRRQPNEIQARAISHLRLLLEACDHGETVQVSTSGRRNLQLMARLQELALAAESLGLSSSPYQGHSGEHAVPVNNDAFPQLSPFSNLVPERLKITGRGHWDASQYIEPEFYMALQEPQSIELSEPIFDRGVPNFAVDQPATVLSLFKKWDDLGLLILHPADSITTGESGRVKIFNAYKSAEVDRQIGDRRERNAWEFRMPGPSAQLPVGPLIGRLVVPPGSGLKVCITDRSDFYHQIGVSFERSRTNIVWPAMPLQSFVEFKAYQKYCQKASSHRKRPDRMVFGDDLNGHRPQTWSTDPACMVYGGFGAVLQGDHLGVEIGISAHVGLLQQHGLLADKGRLVMGSLVRPADVYQGLVIDDFFCIAPVPLAELSHDYSGPPSAARRAFDKAKKVYAEVGLAGSDAKDVIDKSLTTVVGAEVDSRVKVVSKGILPVGAPAAKRLSLSWIAACASRYGWTSDSLHASLVGGLTSAFCFKRCSMSILNELYKVIPAEELNTEKPKLRALSRSAAEELILSAVLLPVLVSDVKAPFHEWIYASDASTKMGAFCEARISENLAHPLWLAGDFKGARVSLDSWQKVVFRDCNHLGELESESEEAGPEPQPTAASPEKPLAQFYDFIEVCGGSGVVSDEVAKWGFTVGPIIDLTYSGQYDVVNLRVVEWLQFLIIQRRVRALMLEPPCTTFSAAAYPPCRSYRVPRGFNQLLSKVWIGNRLAFTCLMLLMLAAHHYVIGLLETPRRSKMAWLREWLALLELPNGEETFTASCSFMSIFQKEFRFLTCNMRPQSICKPCARDHKHVRIEGQLTKGSAVYCPGLAAALAELFAKHLRASYAFHSRNSLRADGHESMFVNELVKTAEWEVSAAWKWTGSSHINVLELASALQAVKRIAARGGGRAILLLDSNVALQTIAKGRSSARSLTNLLRKICSLCLAFGISLSVHFCPTRLNVADDPSRSVCLRPARAGGSFLSLLDFDGFFRLAELPKLRRWISNWTCLFLGLCFHHSLRPASLAVNSPRNRSSEPPVDFYHFLLDFDATLGYPGEGPIVCSWIFLIWGVSLVCSHGMMPRHREDQKRFNSEEPGLWLRVVQFSH